MCLFITEWFPWQTIHRHPHSIVKKGWLKSNALPYVLSSPLSRSYITSLIATTDHYLLEQLKYFRSKGGINIPAVYISTSDLWRHTTKIERLREHLSQTTASILTQPWGEYFAIGKYEVTGLYFLHREYRRFLRHLWIRTPRKNKIMYVPSKQIVSVVTRWLFWCLFPSLLRNLGN